MSIIAIDSGSSTVKLIKTEKNGKVKYKALFEKMPIMQALELFLKQEKIDLKSVQNFVLTGVGTEEIKENIYNIPTIKVDEFTAIGLGGLYLAHKDEAIVVSIGTGTALVQAKKSEIKHIGGTGIGGGTLLNLCKEIGRINSINKINECIQKGNLENVDLKIKDVSTHEFKTLPKDTTSANFGKLNENATKEDKVMGIANMVFEIIGVMAVFAAQNTGIENIIVIGNVACMPYMKVVLEKIEKLHSNVKFIIPELAEFATAVGAVKSIN